MCDSCRFAGWDRETPGVKKILLLISVVFVLCGCGGGAAGGTARTYELEGNKVSFTAPPAPWLEKTEVHQPQHDDGVISDKVITTGVAFLKDKYDGYFFVGAMPQNKDVKTDSKGKVLSETPIDLEKDQDTLDVLAMRVDKRNGKRLKQEWIPIAGTNAFHMVFEVGPDNERQKGEQVHFTKGGVHYTLSMLMPIKDYDAEVGHYQQMVSSFKLESMAKPK